MTGRGEACSFNVGDNVLLLLPTDSNKLLLHGKDHLKS